MTNIFEQVFFEATADGPKPIRICDIPDREFREMVTSPFGVCPAYFVEDGKLMHWEKDGHARCISREADEEEAQAELQRIILMEFFNSDRGMGCFESEEKAREVSFLSHLDFANVDSIRAIPTAGGIIDDSVRTNDYTARFPDAVCIPVSEAVEESFSRQDGGSPRFVIVAVAGEGYAVTSEEAARFGLVECPNWFPDLTGVNTSAPAPGEIAAHLAANT